MCEIEDMYCMLEGITKEYTSTFKSINPEERLLEEFFRQIGPNSVICLVLSLLGLLLEKLSIRLLGWSIWRIGVQYLVFFLLLPLFNKVEMPTEILGEFGEIFTSNYF